MRRRTRLVVIGGAVLALGALLAVALAGPRLTCAWLAWRCPWPVDAGLAITGAGLAGGPQAPPVLVTASAQDVHAALARGGVRLPSWWLAPGQRTWGTLAGTPWLLRVEPAVPVPTLAARLDQAQAAAVVAAYLGQQEGWALRVDRLDLRVEPDGDDLRVELRAAGALRSALLARYGVPAEVWVPVEALVVDGVLRREGRLLRPDLTVRQAGIAYQGLRMQVAAWIDPLARRTLADPALRLRLPRAWPWPFRAAVQVE